LPGKPSRRLIRPCQLTGRSATCCPAVGRRRSVVTPLHEL